MNQQLQKERRSLLNVIIKSSAQFKAKQKMTLLLACSQWILYSQAPLMKPRQWRKLMKHICKQGLEYIESSWRVCFLCFLECFVSAQFGGEGEQTSVWLKIYLVWFYKQRETWESLI